MHPRQVLSLSSAIPAIPADESARIESLRRYQILDTLPEQAFEDITFLAAHICETPIALISFVDSDRQWFKSKVGLEANQTSREGAFCAHAILKPHETLVVHDAALDARFAGNPLVLGQPNIRFYLGSPLVVPDGQPLGTICVIDRVPREPTTEQLAAISALSRQVAAQLELRRQAADLRKAIEERDRFLAQLDDYRGQLEEANSRLQAQAQTDQLTELANRAAFDRRLDEEVYRAERYGTPFSLLLLDVDHFKEFNDRFGHPAGDAVLREVAQVLRRTARTSDFVARYGGEEFAVILPGTGREGASVLGERFRKAVESGPWPQHQVTISVGATTYKDVGTTGSDLVHSADEALYRAKNRGRNQTVHAVDAVG